MRVLLQIVKLSGYPKIFVWELCIYDWTCLALRTVSAKCSGSMTSLDCNIVRSALTFLNDPLGGNHWGITWQGTKGIFSLSATQRRWSPQSNKHSQCVGHRKESGALEVPSSKWNTWLASFGVSELSNSLYSYNSVVFIIWSSYGWSNKPDM